jgi:hypothetical protein
LSRPSAVLTTRSRRGLNDGRGEDCWGCRDRRGRGRRRKRRHQTKAHTRPQFDRRTLLVKLKGHADYAALGVRLVREIPHTDWALVAVHENAGAVGSVKLNWSQAGGAAAASVGGGKEPSKYREP